MLFPLAAWFVGCPDTKGEIMSKRKRVSSARRRFQPGKASDYIDHLDDLPPGDELFLISRVSRCSREQRKNLQDSEADLRQIASKKGFVVLKVFTHTGSGFDPIWLTAIAAEAKRRGATLVAEDTTRFIRNMMFRSNKRNRRKMQATTIDLEELKWCTLGVRLATVLPPDASPDEEHGYHIERGQRTKGNKGGRKQRPKTRKKQHLEKAKEMRSEGKSWNEISRALGVPRTTVRRWVLTPVK